MNLVKQNRTWFPSLLEEMFEHNWAQDPLAKAQLPAVNINETEKEFQLEVAAPGMKKSDFNLEVENDLLTISAQREASSETKEDNFLRKEFSYQSFARSFHLPEGVVSDDIQAEYKDGILKLSIPKSPEILPKKRSISVK